MGGIPDKALRIPLGFSTRWEALGISSQSPPAARPSQLVWLGDHHALAATPAVFKILRDSKKEIYRVHRDPYSKGFQKRNGQGQVFPPILIEQPIVQPLPERLRAVLWDALGRL